MKVNETKSIQVTFSLKRSVCPSVKLNNKHLAQPDDVKYLNIHLDRKLTWRKHVTTRVGTLVVATIYLQLIQNRYMFRSFTVLQCSHQHCVQPVASDVEDVGYL